ncbi:GM22840 [Drosophila sechellia]|uniref:GM22840 n=1 Tax=Drosophila sechellia TaxID=7238 RepID=B4I6M4_DROSE|nr:GM22840 [Drosophila sechellia]
MTMWQSGGMGGHGSQNNPWMKLMGIVHKERRHTENVQSQSGSNERNLNQEWY